MTLARLALLILLLALLGVAGAVEIEILEADRLEQRPLQLPGGGETELTVITGSPVRLQVDGDLIIAEYVEFDTASRTLRIVGPGNVGYDNVSTEGRDYVLDLSSGELNFRDVFIFTEPLDIEGLNATRQPGQIDISAGLFSPCSRCERDVQDYRFSAERMNFYPGDRLVAFNVTVYIRELPSFFLPLMVVPLGPEERRPRFNLTRGTATERAEVALDWPYVFGANAFGTTSLRYYADVAPNLSNGPAETILGGTVQESYFGGGFEHRFYTERGRGELTFFYTPPFLPEFEGGEQTREAFSYTAGFETEAELEGFQTDLLLSRDDELNPRILNLTARASDRYGGFTFAYVTQTYFDLDLSPLDTSYSPSYEQSEGALRTYARVQASPDEGLTFSAGPFTLTNLLLEAGVYEDYANSSNTSAVDPNLVVGGRSVVRAGRLLGRQTLTLAPLSPFSGSSLSGSTSYTGQLYTTANPDGELERLVDWTTTLNAEQTFTGGSFGLDFSRVILEGETPFGFDVRTPNSRTALGADLRYAPADWVSLSVTETYVFDDTDEGEEGAGALRTRAELFGNLDYLDLTVEQVYDPEANDAGLVGASARVTSPDDVLTSSATLSGVYDLNRTEPTFGAVADESEVDFITSVGYLDFVEVEAAVGYDFNDATGDFSSGFDSSFGSGFDTPYDGLSGLEPGSEAPGDASRYKPLVLGVTAGTLEQEDALPGLSVSYERDINSGDTEEISYEASTRLGPLEFTAQQTFDFDTDSPDAGDTLFTLSYPDIVQLQASGFTPVPPSLLGLVPDPEDSSTYQVSLEDLTQQDLSEPLYELTYATTYGAFTDSDGLNALGFNSTNLTGRVNLETTFLETGLGPLGFGLEFSSELEIADDALPLTYLSNASSELTIDFFSRVGLQGTLTYAAQYSGDLETGLSTQSLTLEDFGPTVRLWDDLYISALLYDIWDFTGTSNATPYNFQPFISVTLDRCCWALNASLDTSDGTFSLSLGYPGTEEALTGAITTALELPRRRYE